MNSLIPQWRIKFKVDNKRKFQRVWKLLFNSNISGSLGHSARVATRLLIVRLAGSTYRRTVLQLRAWQGHLSPLTEFQIDKIVQTRNKGCIKQHLVKWRGYDEIFNSTVNASEIKKIWRITYETLPSDSSAYFFPTTLASFKTKLATTIELEPDKWAVALVEISYLRGYRKRLL